MTPSVLGDLIVFVVILVIAIGGGLTLGMLLAPRVGRLSERGHDAAPPEDGRDDSQP